jgi:hypothetical protein
MLILFHTAIMPQKIGGFKPLHNYLQINDQKQLNLQYSTSSGNLETMSQLDNFVKQVVAGNCLYSENICHPNLEKPVMKKRSYIVSPADGLRNECIL